MTAAIHNLLWLLWYTVVQKVQVDRCAPPYKHGAHSPLMTFHIKYNSQSENVLLIFIHFRLMITDPGGIFCCWIVTWFDVATPGTTIIGGSHCYCRDKFTWVFAQFTCHGTYTKLLLWFLSIYIFFIANTCKFSKFVVCSGRFTSCCALKKCVYNAWRWCKTRYFILHDSTYMNPIDIKCFGSILKWRVLPLCAIFQYIYHANICVFVIQITRRTHLMR